MTALMDGFTSLKSSAFWVPWVRWWSFMTQSTPGSVRTGQSGTNSMQPFLRSPASGSSGSSSSGTCSTSLRNTDQDHSIVIQDIESIDDMRIAQDLQKEVWVLQDRDIIPLTQLVAVRHAGGQLIGARDG